MDSTGLKASAGRAPPYEGPSPLPAWRCGTGGDERCPGSRPSRSKASSKCRSTCTFCTCHESYFRSAVQRMGYPYHQAVAGVGLYVPLLIE